MKPYSEQIAAIQEAIKYKTHEVNITQDIINQQTQQGGKIELIVTSLRDKQQQLLALQDATSTIIAVERDEKLFLAAGDLLEALKEVLDVLPIKHNEGQIERAKEAIKKARFG